MDSLIEINNDKLFFKVFRNIYLKMVIFYHIRLFNYYEFKDNHTFTIEEFQSFKFKDHLSKLRLMEPIQKLTTTTTTTNNYIKGELSKLIPNSVKSLSLDINNQLVVGDIKDGLTSLKFGKRFDQKLTPGLLVTDGSLVEFNSGSAFKNGDISLQVGSIASSIKSLTFGESFNSIINVNVLPEGLVKLRFKGFNKMIVKNSLPNSLLELEFGGNFNRAISAHGTLPKSLTSLTLGIEFTHVIYRGTLPPTLKKLVIQSTAFNQKFENKSLPDSLEHLEFIKNGFFNQPIADNFLPPNLKTLILPEQWSNNFQPILAHQLPTNLTDLQFYSNECSLFLQNDSIPSTVLNLRINGILSDHYNFTRDPVKKLKGSIVPSSITSIETGTIINLSHCIHLKNFKFDESFYQRSLFKGYIPSTVTNLILPPLWNRELICDTTTAGLHLFPNCLKFLDLASYNYPIGENVLPPNLESLIINSWDLPIEKNTLPQSLTYLSMKSFNQRLTPSSLPKNLKTLILHKYNVSLVPNCFPQSIRLIKLGPIFERNNILYPFNNKVKIIFGKNDINFPIYPKFENKLRCSV
ncbi:hypothetical protein ACTFIZ_000740 [Dictyostelium cf. discoideum]